MMLGICDIWNCCHHLKSIGEDVTKTMKAQRRNVPRAMILGDIIQPLWTRPASAYLQTCHEKSHIFTVQVTFRQVLFLLLLIHWLTYTFLFLARYFLLNSCPEFWSYRVLAQIPSYHMSSLSVFSTAAFSSSPYSTWPQGFQTLPADHSGTSYLNFLQVD